VTARKLSETIMDRQQAVGLTRTTKPMKKSRSRLHMIFRPEPERGYTASVPALPGCVTYGRTLEQAKELVKDAIAGYIESLKKHGEPIPTDDESLVTTLDLE